MSAFNLNDSVYRFVRKIHRRGGFWRVVAPVLAAVYLACLFGFIAFVFWGYWLLSAAAVQATGWFKTSRAAELAVTFVGFLIIVGVTRVIFGKLFS